MPNVFRIKLLMLLVVVAAMATVLAFLPGCDDDAGLYPCPRCVESVPQPTPFQQCIAKCPAAYSYHYNFSSGKFEYSWSVWSVSAHNACVSHCEDEYLKPKGEPLPDGGSEDLPLDGGPDATCPGCYNPPGSDGGAQDGGSDGGVDDVDQDLCHGERGIGGCVSACVRGGYDRRCCVRVCKEECRS